MCGEAASFDPQAWERLNAMIRANNPAFFDLLDKELVPARPFTLADLFEFPTGVL